ncbi:MAG TPA: carboxypeptidase-like regulatory domain-containing protein [Longimicrobiales bacterium]
MLLLAGFPVGASPLAAQVSLTYEEGIVEVVADRLAPLTLLVLVDSAGSLLLPLEQVAGYLGLTTSRDGTSLILPGIGGVVAVDTATRVLSARAGRVSLAPAELVSSPIPYLRAERIGELLGALVRVDLAALVVTFSRDPPFPAQQRVITEQRRAVLLSRRSAPHADDGKVPYTSATGAGVLDWEIATNGLDPARLTTIRTDAGVAVLGGDLNGGAAFEVGHDATDAVRDPVLRYQRVFPHGRYITQVRVGDVVTSGLFARYMRGLEISNRPFLRPAELTTVLLQPDLPTGWEYEVFQGNQLLGYSDLASMDPVAVPLRAGATPVQIRMYGPAGEEVVTRLLYQTPVSLLSRGRAEYSVGFGRCASACDELAHADVRYGVSPLFTTGAGVELFSDSTGYDIRPYFVHSLSTGTRATAELTYMPFSLYAANLAVFPRDGSSAQVRASVSRSGLGPISLVRDADMRWDTEVLWDERLDPGSPFSQLRAGASAAGPLDGIERWRLSAAGSFRRGFLEARYDRDRISTSRHLLSARAALFTPFAVGARTLRPLLMAAVGGNGRGLQLGEIGVSIQPRASAVVTAGAQWSRASTRPALSLGYSAHIGSMRSALRAVSSASGVASSSLMLAGSSALTHDGSITLQPFARTGYAGLHGTVFVDNDGDGRVSAGDAGVPDMHLIIAGHRTVSDAAGHFRVWGLQPYQPAVIAIDSTRTPDPSFSTVRGELVVRPVPNTALRADIGLVRTRELIGTVTAEAGVATVAGLTIELTSLDTGALTSTTTFSDGVFYISRVRPGRYRAAVAASSLAALAAAASPAGIEFVVPPGGDDIAVELPAIRLTRTR